MIQLKNERAQSFTHTIWFRVICFLSRINLFSVFLHWYPGLFLEMAINVILHMILKQIHSSLKVTEKQACSWKYDTNLMDSLNCKNEVKDLYHTPDRRVTVQGIFTQNINGVCLQPSEICFIQKFSLLHTKTYTPVSPASTFRRRRDNKMNTLLKFEI